MDEKIQQPEPVPQQIEEEKKPRVLICDDSRMVRASIIKHIKDTFDIREAGDGEAGWTALNEDDTIQVLISDLSMPKLDGFGLLKRLRSSEVSRLREMPVIVISGEEEGVAQERAAAAGATDFITKGIGAVELHSRLEALVKLNKASRQLEKSRDAIANFLLLRGAQIYAHARRRVNDVAVLRIFLDTQEDVAKRFGKPVSDQLLVFFGKLLASRMRKEDCIARMGDAEFALICPSTALSNANQFAARLKDAVSAAKVNFRDEIIHFTASIGVANTDQDLAENIDDLFVMADSRMRRARGGGGNTLVSSDELQAKTPLTQPSVDEALSLLATGEAERVAPHLAALVERLLPLLKVLSEKLGVKIPIEELEKAGKVKQ
jgi:diguanylate cyclase (GGDEF)-like protein